MTALSIFRYADTDVRTVVINGEPWFVLSDLVRVLGLSQFRAERLDGDLIQNHPIADRTGRSQMTRVVSEAGMYEVVIRSDKPEAAAFRRWITAEVLPEIRRTGSYGATPALPQNYTEALRELLATVERNAQLEARAAEDAPKVEAYDQLMDADGYYSMESAAKMCGVGRTTLYRRLREAGVIQPGSTLPYQRYMHHFILTASSWTDGDGNVHPTQTTRVRPSGLPFILRKAQLEAVAS